MRGARPLPASVDIEHAQILYGWVEIGKYFRRSQSTVRRWHEDRRLPIAYIGASLVVPRSALDLWVLAGRTSRSKDG